MHIFPNNRFQYYGYDFAGGAQGSIDTNVMLSHPISFVGMKMGQATWKEPRYFETYYSNFRRKIAIAGYHYFEPLQDPIRQAEFARDLAMSHSDINRVFVDAEQNGDKTGRINMTGKPYDAIPVEDYWDRLMIYIDYLDRKLPKKIGIYSSAAFLNVNSPLSLRSRTLKKTLDIYRPWWLASYPSAGPTPPPATANVYLPRFLSSYKGVIWQFWADKNNRGREAGASSNDIDMNALYGGITEFRSIFGVEPRTLPVADDGVWPKVAMTNTQIAIRVGPSEADLQAGWANSKSIWTVYGLSKDNRGRGWYRITSDENKLSKYIAAWLCKII